MFTFFLLSFILVILLSKLLSPLLVKKLRLIDHPDDNRKVHTKPTPLIGGILILLTIVIVYFFNLSGLSKFHTILIVSFGLLILGVLDDKYDINAKFRLVFQIAAALILIFINKTQLSSFGDILFLGNITLGFFAIPVSVIAVVALINALNLIDGIDGLASGLSLICFLSLAWLLQNQPTELLLLLTLSGAIAGFICLNLDLIPFYKNKMFLGDAGSLVLGFIIVFFLIEYSQNTPQAFNPVTALWITALPLIDIAVTLIRRVLNGKSPFFPDKTHIHHLLMQSGLSARKTLLILLLIQSLITVFGIYLNNYESISFTLFVVIIIIYAFGTTILNKR